jgi:hypothetical protein
MSTSVTPTPEVGEKKAERALRELFRTAGGPYTVAKVLLELLREEDGGRASSNHGTRAQDLLMERVAHLVVGGANGCDRRFAYILEAVAEARGVHEEFAPMLCRAFPSGVKSVTSFKSEDVWRERQRAWARNIVAGDSDPRGPGR